MKEIGGINLRTPPIHSARCITGRIKLNRSVTNENYCDLMPISSSTELSEIQNFCKDADLRHRRLVSNVV